MCQRAYELTTFCDFKASIANITASRSVISNSQSIRCLHGVVNLAIHRDELSVGCA